MLELLESRRLLAGGVDPLGVATGAGPDTNLWFTLNSNAIGKINPANPGGGITQYAIPTPKSGAGPLAAGPQAILYASDIDNGQIYKVDKTTGILLQTIPVSEGLDSLIFDNNNDLIYTAWSADGVGQVRRVDPTVGISSDTLLATIGNGGHDLALVPGGNFVLATSDTTGEIYEVNLNDPGQTPTTFGSGQYTDGLAFDSQGRLFAVSNDDAVVELDPQTFQVIASSGPMQGLDGMTYDSFTGNLFVSSYAVNATSGRKGLYEVSLQPGSFLDATLITNSAFPATFRPDGLESDGKGNVYVASLGDKIYQYDIITGQLTALTSVLPGLDDLVPLSGTGGHSAPEYWFFEQSADKFGAIEPTTGHITETRPLSTANTQVNGITPGPGGTIWFTESNTDRIGVIDTDTDAITEFPLTTPGADPYGIVEAPDGTIWFTEAGANRIGSINPTTHHIQEYPIDSSGNDQAESIAIGPDKNLWFTLTGTNKIGKMNPTTGAMIGEYSVPTANAGLSQIVSDPADGNLWFTEKAANNVGTIDPTTKAIDESAVPTAGAAPLAMAVNTSGNIWFTESNGGRIAEFSPNNPNSITEYGVPIPQPNFSGLTEETVTYGSTVTFTGTLAAGPLVPVGEEVAVTVNGVTQNATIASDGSFSISFSGANVMLNARPLAYDVIYAYAGDGIFLAADGSSQLTVNPEALTITATGDTKVYDGTTGATAVPTITSGSLAAGDTANFTEARHQERGHGPDADAEWSRRRRQRRGQLHVHVRAGVDRRDHPGRTDDHGDQRQQGLRRDHRLVPGTDVRNALPLGYRDGPDPGVRLGGRAGGRRQHARGHRLCRQRRRRRQGLHRHHSGRLRHHLPRGADHHRQRPEQGLRRDAADADGQLQRPGRR